MNQTELHSLAQALRRPPLSLSALASLPPDRLAWLARQVHQACEAAEGELGRDLNRVWPLRLLMPRRLRGRA